MFVNLSMKVSLTFYGSKFIRPNFQLDLTIEFDIIEVFNIFNSICKNAWQAEMTLEPC